MLRQSGPLQSHSALPKRLGAEMRSFTDFSRSEDFLPAVSVAVSGVGPLVLLEFVATWVPKVSW